MGLGNKMYCPYQKKLLLAIYYVSICLESQNHSIIKVEKKPLKSLSPTTVNPHMIHESNTTVFNSKPYPQVPYPHNFLDSSRDDDSTRFLSSFFQCLTTFLSEEIFLNSIFNWLFPNIQSNDSSSYEDCSYVCFIFFTILCYTSLYFCIFSL